jgi:hypothetical protein
MDIRKPIVVDFDLSFGELYAATLRILIYVLRYLFLAIALLGLLYGICLVLAGAKSSSWDANANPLAEWLSPVLIGAVPTLIVMIPLVTLVRAKMFLRKTGDGKRRYEFSSEVVKIETPLAKAEAKWSAFAKARESGNYFFLYVVPGFANVIPKRTFTDQGSLEEFRALVRAKVPKAKLRS